MAKKHKIVYNACYGCYGFSKKACEWLTQRGWSGAKLERHDPLLVQCVEELGEDANGDYARLKIAKITSSRYIIHEYDGYESVVVPRDINWIKIEK